MLRMGVGAVNRAIGPLQREIKENPDGEGVQAEKTAEKTRRSALCPGKGIVFAAGGIFCAPLG